MSINLSLEKYTIDTILSIISRIHEQIIQYQIESKLRYIQQLEYYINNISNTSNINLQVLYWQLFIISFKQELMNIALKTTSMSWNNSNNIQSICDTLLFIKTEIAKSANLDKQMQKECIERLQHYTNKLRSSQDYKECIQNINNIKNTKILNVFKQSKEELNYCLLYQSKTTLNDIVQNDIQIERYFDIKNAEPIDIRRVSRLQYTLNRDKFRDQLLILQNEIINLSSPNGDNYIDYYYEDIQTITAILLDMIDEILNQDDYDENEEYNNQIIHKLEWHCDSISAVDSLKSTVDFIKLSNILDGIIKDDAINIPINQNREAELKVKFLDTYTEAMIMHVVRKLNDD